LEGIHIRASVEVICALTFDAGSRLQRIERYAFEEIPAKEMVLPNVVVFLSGSAFRGTPLDFFTISPGPANFILNPNFLKISPANR
jgi:hypothetical protein